MRKVIDWFQNIYSDLDNKKIWLFYALFGLAGVGLVVFFLSVPFFYKQNEFQTTLQETKTQIQQLNLQSFENKKNKLTRQRLEMNSRLEELRSDFLTQKSIFAKYAFTQFKDDKLSLFLDTLMKRSKTRNLKLSEVLSIQPKKQEASAQIIEIKGSGKYTDIMTYIHELLAFDALLGLQSYTVWIEEGELVFEVSYRFGKEDV